MTKKTKKVNLCKDCKYIVNRRWCGKVVDLVDESPKFMCYQHRDDWWLHMYMNNTCGKSGRWFEAKDA